MIARLAAHQDGVVTRAQLLARGASPRAIDHRVASARLPVAFRGVYAVGHSALSQRGRLRAALLAAGPTAALSFRTAAVLYRLIRSMPPFVEVTLRDRRPRSRPGLVFHHAATLETWTRDGFPVTSPQRTLADLARVLGPDELDRARSEALFLGLVPRSAAPAAEPTRSGLERRLLAALRAARLPAPLVNHRLGGYTPDFLWPGEKLIVETDGWAAHGHRAAFERDRARDADLQARGYAVLRFTWRQVLDETLPVVVRIGQLLAARTPHHAPTTPPAGG